MLSSLYGKESVVFLPWNSLGTETLTYSITHEFLVLLGPPHCQNLLIAFPGTLPQCDFTFQRGFCVEHNTTSNWERDGWYNWLIFPSSLIALLLLSSWSDVLLLCRLARHTGSTPKVVNKRVSTTTKSICLHWLWVELTYKLFDTSLRIVSVKKQIILHCCYILATFFSCYWVSRVQLHCTCSSGSKNMERPLKKLIKNLELYVSILDEAVHLLPSTGCVKIVLHSLSI